ncbi:MAG TPA: glycine betaine ABC transporter substrate-binding protein, partial [Actinotalea sp.]|nr:glycine betaine ABC transporter substrate-binding protein [Actinotalea sp.]
MRAGRPLLTAATLGLAFVVAACGSPGSSTGATTTPPDDEMTSPAGGGVCEAVAGDQLVVLEDDLGLQLSDNVVPAVNAAAAQASPGLVGVLDSVSAVLDTETLIQLNKQVDVDRRTSSEVAQTFLADQGLDDVEQVGDGVSITVGAPNFSEGATLAEVYAGALTAAGFAARTETIGNRETY